jgi:RimJ/RimL family protein N-acetyltransferase
MKSAAVTAPERLDGGRVYLRPMVEADTDSILRWRSDPEVARQMFSERPPTRSEHEAWLGNIRDTGNRLEFVIVFKATDSACGTVGLAGLDGANPEFGVMLGEPDLRGQGLAFEASHVLLDFAFKVLKLEQVMLRLFADNVEAKRLYDRLGFTLDPAAAGERVKDGMLRKTAVMRLNRSSWLRQKTGKVRGQ